MFASYILIRLSALIMAIFCPLSLIVADIMCYGDEYFPRDEFTCKFFSMMRNVYLLITTTLC